jgi:hypothetical protein
VPRRPVPFLDFAFAEAHRFSAERAFAHPAIVAGARRVIVAGGEEYPAWPQGKITESSEGGLTSCDLTPYRTPYSPAQGSRERLGPSGRACSPVLAGLLRAKGALPAANAGVKAGRYCFCRA